MLLFFSGAICFFWRGGGVVHPFSGCVYFYNVKSRWFIFICCVSIKEHFFFLLLILLFFFYLHWFSMLFAFSSRVVIYELLCVLIILRWISDSCWKMFWRLWMQTESLWDLTHQYVVLFAFWHLAARPVIKRQRRSTSAEVGRFPFYRSRTFFVRCRKIQTSKCPGKTDWSETKRKTRVKSIIK